MIKIDMDQDIYPIAARSNTLGIRHTGPLVLCCPLYVWREKQKRLKAKNLFHWECWLSSIVPEIDLSQPVNPSKQLTEMELVIIIPTVFSSIKFHTSRGLR